jgi:hypothetical protein
MVALMLLMRTLGRVIEIALAEQRAGPGEFPGIRAPRRGLAKTPILQPRRVRGPIRPPPGQSWPLILSGPRGALQSGGQFDVSPDIA